ncbi:MAG: sulfotransferase domain-containing protein [Pirellulaceae bacterium]|nr:sulfotransferase domain-containing protein [Pirellulaceae bacterium]
MPAPSFFIVGAPKCGTTSLNDYLRQHPGIFIPDRKELHHFGSDLRFFKTERPALGEYLAYFASAQPIQIAGEASVWYLFSQLAAQEIRDFCPGAKIIIMLRNPADMLHSLHSQYLFESNEDLTDFAAALAAEEDRSQGRRLPPNSNYREGLLYRRVARFDEQVRRYLDVFRREQIHIIDFDDFSRDTPRVFAEVLQFLGVDSSFRCEFEIRNPNKQVHSRPLHNFLNNPGAFAILLGRLIPQSLRRAIVSRLKKANSPAVPRAPLSAKLRAQLNREFAPEIQRLEELVGRDFSKWLA